MSKPKTKSRTKRKTKVRTQVKVKNLVLKNRQKISKMITASDNVSIVPDKFRDVQTSYFEIGVVRKEQRGVYTYSGEMNLITLAAIVNVDRYKGDEADKIESCQRGNTEVQGQKFGEFISDKRNVCLAEILINDRFKHAQFISLRDMGVAVPMHRKMETTHGVLRIPSDAITFTYDGQTRRFGYLTLLHYDEEIIGTAAYKDFKNLNIPFCLSQVSAQQETQFFLNHNGRQTTVPSVHRAIVSYHANRNSRVITNQTNSEITYSIVAGACYNMVNDKTGPWYNNIMMPDTPKDANRNGLIGSFNTGLKHLVGWMRKEYWSPEISDGVRSRDLSDVCSVFWKAVKVTCPKIWRNQDAYVMTTSQGIASLSLLMHVLYKDFFNADITWNITNISKELKKSNIITTPKKWLKNGDISKRGGNYKALTQLQMDIYMQMKR